MKPGSRYKILLFFLLGLFAPVFAGGILRAAEIRTGNIYLQVEQNGEAWYVHPATKERFFLGRPDDAWELLRGQGGGISNDDLKKIPLGVLSRTSLAGLETIDADGDGLSDHLENSLGTNSLLKDSDADGSDDYSEAINGYNPLGQGVMPVSLDFSRRYLGYIFLQVEAHGEAWYVNPADSKRYYLGQKEDAFAIMRSLGVGIRDADLEQISLSKSSREALVTGMSVKTNIELVNNVDLRRLEFLIMELVNHERLKAGLYPASWNSDLAAVAREHSQNLATENESFTGFNKACDFPIIHHEGIEFGPYNSDRIKARGIYYYQKTGENIALVSAGRFSVKFLAGDPVEEQLADCAAVRAIRDRNYETKLENEQSISEKISLIKDELDARQDLYGTYAEAETAEIYWYTGLELAQESITGWMNSPGHRDNILNPDYGEAGVGAAYVNGYLITTQIFIERATCGYQGGPCCKEPGYLPYCFLPLSCGRDNLCQP